MDKRSGELMEYLSKAMAHPDVSGFEVIEILDVRSRLAAREPLLGKTEKAKLEDIDRQFLGMAQVWLSRISEVAELGEMRQRANALPSHWWWYLDEITVSREKRVG